MCALIGSSVAKIYGLTNMTKKPHLCHFHIFSQNLDKIYSFVVQAVTVLCLMTKNIGVVHHSKLLCVPQWLGLLQKNM